MYFSDIVISAGGTMNREAAILGTPVYTIFAGKLPAVDRKLMELGRLNVIASEQDIANLPLKKRPSKEPLRNENLINDITQQILA
jgi:predicted glycosyltransferase